MGMGTMRACFQMAGMEALLRERLKSWVRYLVKPPGAQMFEIPNG